MGSGAHLFDDRPTFDFKATDIDGTPHLTFVTNEDLHETDSPGGSAVILNDSYQRVQEVEDRAGRGTMNMHEYNTLEEGQRALTIIFESKLADLTVDGETQKLFIGNNGFAEIQTETGDPVFTWWALDHIDPTESLVDQPSGPGSYGSPWDAYHINSVDKNQHGDYLISARYTNTIYKVCGKDGRIIWRLGGSKSSFSLKDFNMSSQHDARFRSDNDTTVVITFFNNHSDGHHATAKMSAAMEVALDLSTMEAHVMRQWDRPDGGLSKLRGNAQSLPNGNMFVCWSENSYMSEHTPEGELVMQARMASQRLVSYRAYKMNFTARPSEPIAAKAFVFGIDEGSSTTVTYVSWNGATEVTQWRFFGLRDDQQSTLIGTSNKTGFETMHMSAGAYRQVIAEAMDAQGKSLGKSEIFSSKLPSSWNGRTPSGTHDAAPPDNSDGAEGLGDVDEQTSVSEDLSLQLHAVQDPTDRSRINDHGFGQLMLDRHLLVFSVASFATLALSLYIVRKCRSHRSSLPSATHYKLIGEDV